MKINRRRFLAISAGIATAGMTRLPIHRWEGVALGGQVSMEMHGPEDVAVEALARGRAMLVEIERQFSLFDPQSALSLLNARGRIDAPERMFSNLCDVVDQAHDVTGGLFDPSVQPLWRAQARGDDLAEARSAIGWWRVERSAQAIQLGEGQALTFNGIAQGFATDLIAEMFEEMGLGDVLVNIGEYRGSGGPWRLGIEDPVHGHMGTRSLHGGAIATSSPSAMSLGGSGHILHPDARPLWSTVSVEAAEASVADGLSTALTLAPLEQVRAIVGQLGVTRITVVDHAGDLSSFSAQAFDG